MAIRTLNFTGRQKILRSDVQIYLRSTPRGTSFDVQLRLEDYGFPADSEIFVEAYLLSVWDRFSWGTVATPRPTIETSLSKFGSTEDILFRVKVVDQARGKKVVLGEADQLSPKNNETVERLRVPLLPVLASDQLGELIYRIEFDNSRACLLINSNMGDWRAVARSDAFQSLVYPAAMRQILTRALLIENAEPDADDDSPGWQRDWIRFAMQFPISKPPESAADEEEKLDWIESAVQAFAYRFRLLDAYQRTWAEEGK